MSSLAAAMNDLPPPPPSESPAPVPPPPPPASPIPPCAPTQQVPGLELSQEQLFVIGTLAAAGLVLCVAELFVGPVWLPGVFGMFLIVYSTVVIAGSLPARWISQRLDRVLDKWARDKTGSGYYGMVALAWFAHAEVLDIIDPEDGLLAGWDFVQESLVSHLIGFSAGSIENFVRAMIWPFGAIERDGLLQAGIFAAACWAVFQVGRAFLPMPDMVKVPKPKKPKKGKGSPPA